MNTDAFSTWLEIDKNSISQNVKQIIQICKRPVMAVVKANGYGHGLIEVARAAIAGGATWCGVARIEEALALRQAGIQSQMLVLGYTPPPQIPQAVAWDISVTVYDQEITQLYALQAQKEDKPLAVHVKVDTGMGRLGIKPQVSLDFIKWSRMLPGITIEGIFTHFSRSDEPQADATTRQLEKFIPMLDALKKLGLCPPIVHASNSAAVFYYPSAYYNLVRSGIAVYGLHPSPEAPLPAGFEPALSWKARLISLKILPPGHPVSYGTNYTTRKVERIGVIPVGYADGFRRLKPQEVIIRGKRVPVVGRICMDQSMLLLNSVPDARIGDEVVLIGRQGEEIVTAEEIAKRWQTNNYEVVCGLAARLPRIYLER